MTCKGVGEVSVQNVAQHVLHHTKWAVIFISKNNLNSLMQNFDIFLEVKKTGPNFQPNFVHLLAHEKRIYCISFHQEHVQVINFTASIFLAYFHSRTKNKHHNILHPFQAENPQSFHSNVSSLQDTHTSMHDVFTTERPDKSNFQLMYSLLLSFDTDKLHFVTSTGQRIKNKLSAHSP